jgi:hypothetical protein
MAKRPARKTSRKTSLRSEVKTPALVRYPNANGGALQVGNPGNVGGTGRPRSVIRDRAAQLYDEAGMEFLGKVVKGEKIDVDVTDMFGGLHEIERRPTIKERTDATSLLARVGLGELKEATVEDVRMRLGRTLTVLRRRLAPEEIERAVKENRTADILAGTIEELRPIWAA